MFCFLRKIVFPIVCAAVFGMHGTTNAGQAEKADLVVYSFDRPMQLYAFLESAQQYMTGIAEVIVIYRASTVAYDVSYEVVRQRFPSVVYMVQSEKPLLDFKPLTVQAVFDSPSRYVVFAVDDIIVKDYICCSDDIQALEQHNAYGVYYRLGSHLSYCYTMNAAQAVPPLKQVSDGLYAWQFKQGQHDWGYPNTVDMTLYRKKDIESFFKNGNYNTPNTLEGRWAGQAGAIMHRTGLCYAASKMVNLPLNRVQHDYPNRHMEVSAQELQTLFEQGLKIDIRPLCCVANISAHMEYEPTFVQR
jgi:hypothetical protein